MLHITVLGSFFVIICMTHGLNKNQKATVLMHFRASNHDKQLFHLKNVLFCFSHFLQCFLHGSCCRTLIKAPHASLIPCLIKAFLLLEDNPQFLNGFCTLVSLLLGRTVIHHHFHHNFSQCARDVNHSNIPHYLNKRRESILTSLFSMHLLCPQNCLFHCINLHLLFRYLCLSTFFPSSNTLCCNEPVSSSYCVQDFLTIPHLHKPRGLFFPSCMGTFFVSLNIWLYPLGKLQCKPDDSPQFKLLHLFHTNLSSFSIF
mmetsp:Transcript_21385/g.43171  ORF Transcript_21385/g.43171 Transcript_21385/m.43171 type:complete len:258 (-) Transcript_21385:779-1552(-)